MSVRLAHFGQVSMEHVATLLVIMSLSILVPMTIIGSVACYDIFFGPPVLVYLQQPVPVATPVVSPGHPLRLVLERCALDPFSPDPLVYTFTRELVSVDTGLVVGTETGSASMNHGCATDGEGGYVETNVVSQQVPSGLYVVRGTSTAAGRFKVSVVQWQSVPFAVSSTTDG